MQEKEEQCLDGPHNSSTRAEVQPLFRYNHLITGCIFTIQWLNPFPWIIFCTTNNTKPYVTLFPLTPFFLTVCTTNEHTDRHFWKTVCADRKWSDIEHLDLCQKRVYLFYKISGASQVICNCLMSCRVHLLNYCVLIPTMQ